jgi:hypothetical protein
LVRADRYSGDDLDEIVLTNLKQRVLKASASKKSLHASEQDRPDVAGRRAQWKRYQGSFDPARLVFIDETWAKDQHDAHPWTHAPWRTAGGEGSAWPVANADLPGGAAVGPPRRSLRHRWADQRHGFLAYVEQMLVPTLEPGDIVIIDNLGGHKGKAVDLSASARSIVNRRPQLPIPSLDRSKAWLANRRQDPRRLTP